MKKTLIILLCVFSLNALSQSHYFDNCEENTTKNGEWGEWVYSFSEVKISYTSEGKSIGINTAYKIQIFRAGQSHARVDFSVYFSKMEGGWYRYEILAAHTGAEGVKYLKCNTKLSLMANGESGTINIWTYDGTGIGFYCKK